MKAAEQETTHLPNRVRFWRLRRGLSQNELAERIGCSFVQVSRLETGTRQLTMDWLTQLSATLDVPVAELLSHEQNPWQLSDDERRLIAAVRATGGRTLDAVINVAEIMRGDPALRPEDD